MAEGRFDADAFAAALRDSYLDFAGKRARNDPGFLARYRRIGRRQGALAAPFALLPGPDAGIAGRRFLFHSLRYETLIASFSASECAVTGAPRESARVRALGLPFVPSTDLMAAAGGALFGHAWIPWRRVLHRWRAFFARQADPCFLVLPNDTLPLTTLLARLAASCPNMVVTCVQHGLFNSCFDEDDIDGRNSALNLVYDEAQRREMERRLPTAIAEAMGLPDQFEGAGADGASARTAILVGTGTLGEHAEYRHALDLYARLEPALAAAGFEVRYRPHPTEAGVDEGKDRFAQDRSPKRELLGAPRKAFVGFNSTLLYEAQATGHDVVVLDDPALPGYSLAPIGRRFDASDAQGVAGWLASAQAQAPAPVAPLRARFEAALARAQARRAQAAG